MTKISPKFYPPKEHAPTPLDNYVIVGSLKEEMETVIVIPRDGNRATISTTDNTVLTKLRKCFRCHPDEWAVSETTRPRDEGDQNRITSITVTGPKKYVSLRGTSGEVVLDATDSKIDSESSIT